MHTLNCHMLCRDGRPWIVGTPGGDRQVQWNVQAITNLVDHEMSIGQVGDYGLGSRRQFILMDGTGILHGVTDRRVPGVARGI